MLAGRGGAELAAPTGESIRDAFTKVRDVPSVVFGPATFDVASRRVKGAMNAELVVRKGQFTLWDGKPT